ncbi:MAG: chemotaxis protein [Maritimibacter sp.]|nr:chemotaxis protein [Maritimibacter sp.]
MTFIEKRNELRPATGAAPFSLDEVFFSRTDERGVIVAGNYVFRRVAHYDWARMLGAPHKIIRHPDMPRAVFWLLWDRLKQGRPVGAYVKNRASDGLHYWVFAVVAPCDGGFLSARIKPTSALRDRIEQEYAALRALEREEDLAPEASAALLLERLAALGFSSYERFATHALVHELQARDEGIGDGPDRQLARFVEMQRAAQDLHAATAALVEDFRAMRTIPHNMQVIAARLEPTGGPVSTLSKNYRAVSKEMSDWFEANVVGSGSTFATIPDSVGLSTFLEGMTRILGECDAQLTSERRSLGEVDLDGERRHLRKTAEVYDAKSLASLARVRDEAQRILSACNTMNRHVLGLSTTRLLCKMESGRLSGGGQGLAEIIVQLGTFQERIGARLDRIAGASKEILDLST